MASTDDFDRLDVRVGTVVSAEPFPEGRYSTHVLLVDFGDEFGTKKSLARLAPNYQGPELVGTQVLAVVNFPPRQIGPHRSEVLVLGVPDDQNHVVLVGPQRPVPAGGRLH